MKTIYNYIINGKELTTIDNAFPDEYREAMNELSEEEQNKATRTVISIRTEKYRNGMWL